MQSSGSNYQELATTAEPLAFDDDAPMGYVADVPGWLPVDHLQGNPMNAVAPSISVPGGFYPSLYTQTTVVRGRPDSTEVGLIVTALNPTDESCVG